MKLQRRSIKSTWTEKISEDAGGGEDWEGAQGQFWWVDGNILYLDCGSDYMSI